MIDDPRILKIIRTGYLSDPFEDVICESCQEVIYHGEYGCLRFVAFFTVRDV